MSVPDMSRYSAGFDRGLGYGRDLLKARIVRLLKQRHGKAVRFAMEGDLTATPSVYWQARADLLEVLIKEVEEL